MGLDAQIIGIGPFSKAIAHALEYPADYYASVPASTTVVTTVFEALTSQQSHALAKCFGVEAMDLGRHVLDASAADMISLRAEFGDDPVQHFQALHSAGFQFYFMPRA
jgi:hypothetical protein